MLNWKSETPSSEAWWVSLEGGPSNWFLAIGAGIAAYLLTAIIVQKLRQYKKRNDSAKNSQKDTKD